MIALVSLLTPFNHVLGFFIIEGLVLLVAGDLLAVVHTAEDNLVNKTDRLQYGVKVLFHQVRCRIRLEAYKLCSLVREGHGVPDLSKYGAELAPYIS